MIKMRFVYDCKCPIKISLMINTVEVGKHLGTDVLNLRIVLLQIVSLTCFP